MYCWVAGGIGAGGGFLVGAATSQAALRLGASVGGNCLIAATCFCGIFSHLNSFLPFRMLAVGSIDDVQVAITTHPRFWLSIVVVYFLLFNFGGIRCNYDNHKRNYSYLPNYESGVVCDGCSLVFGCYFCL